MPLRTLEGRTPSPKGAAAGGCRREQRTTVAIFEVLLCTSDGTTVERGDGAAPAGCFLGLAFLFRGIVTVFKQRGGADGIAFQWRERSYGFVLRQ